MMSAAARFHRHHARGPLQSKTGDRLPFHSPAKHNPPLAIQTDQAANFLAHFFPQAEDGIRSACEEHFDFLGYTFGPHYSMRTGRQYIGNSPSKKSVAKIKKNVGDLLVPSN